VADKKVEEKEEEPGPKKDQAKQPEPADFVVILTEGIDTDETIRRKAGKKRKPSR